MPGLVLFKQSSKSWLSTSLAAKLWPPPLASVQPTQHRRLWCVWQAAGSREFQLVRKWRHDRFCRCHLDSDWSAEERWTNGKPRSRKFHRRVLQLTLKRRKVTTKQILSRVESFSLRRRFWNRTVKKILGVFSIGLKPIWEVFVQDGE